MNTDNLKKSREATGLTQAQVADKLGISDGTYKNYEQGKREPNNSLLCRIADIFGVTTDYLLGREQQISQLVKLNLNVKVNDEKFIELYSTLPDEVKKIFVDTMAKLSNAAIDSKNSIKKATTYTCGELENMKKAEQIEAEDAG